MPSCTPKSVSASNISPKFANHNACVKIENTHLLRKRKYRCMANLQFDWLGFSCFAYVELDRDLQVWSYLNKSNRRSAVH